MPDVKGLLESEYLTVDFVTNSPSKKLVILSGGVIAPNQEGRNKLNLLVEIDGVNKKYVPNKLSLVALAKGFGNNSDTWIGKIVSLSIGIIQGKNAIIGSPSVLENQRVIQEQQVQ